ncbi:MAG: hypothetical protein LBL34_00550 [Clostridiales bacterium]|jgi:hypothetical protein|nr:hypothetical protein [Clostridiales bacterium]
MVKIKLFLYDFVTNRKIIKQVAVIILFLAASMYYRSANPGVMLGGAAMYGIGLSMAFLTTLYSILSYSTKDRIKAYLMLPCKKSDVFFAFIFAQLFTLILKRMSFVIIVALLFTQNPVIMIVYLVLSALIAAVLDTVIVMSMNKKRPFLAVICVATIFALYILLIRSQNHILNLSVLIGVALISVVLISRFEPTHLAINREGKMRSNPFGRSNYFFTVLLREKAALINTVFMFGFAIALAFMAKDQSLLMNVVWCIFALNTPISTMFSGDKALLRHEKMLPRQSRLMNGVYGFFLAAYYAVANTFTVVLFIVVKRFDVYVPLTAIALVVLETAIVLLLERKLPIRNWQTKQEVWRNPRKYILPIIVFLVIFLPYIIGT